MLVDQDGLAGLNAIGLIDEIDDLVMGDGYKGKVDDFRIYNRELSAAEIAEIMVEAVPPTPQTWTGSDATDNLWATSGNWSLGTLPEAGQSLEISNGDTIDITAAADFPSFSTISLQDGELALGAGADLDLQSDTKLIVAGGSITRDSSMNTGDINFGIDGISSELEITSGSIQLINEGANVLSFYTDTIISGGDIDVVATTRIYNNFTIQGSGAIINFSKFTTHETPTIHFELDANGLSPIHASTFANIKDAQISIDGSSYTGGAATIPLLTTAKLYPNELPFIVTGFEGRGYTAVVNQSEISNEVSLVIGLDTTDSDGDGYPDWQEVIMGTDPTDASSRLSLELLATDSGIELSWPSVSGRTYTIERSIDLEEWEPYADGITSTTGEDFFIDIPMDDSSPDNGFYRIQVQN